MKDYQLAYQRWMADEQVPQGLREELKGLSETEIEERFYRHLEFGTAGLRGLIGAGTNRMNLYTVRRATEGMARYLTHHVQDAKSKGIVIAFDCRHFSPEFAFEAAGVLAGHGYKTYIYEELRPTPMLSFAVRHYQAAGGIMITASHNPAAYNGFKVYDEQGCQISPYVAELMLAEMEAIGNPLTIPALTREQGMERKLIHLLGEETDKAYTEHLHTLSLRRDKTTALSDDFHIVFTPLHGTGNKPIRRIFEELGYTHVHVVPEQELPDPNFSTITSPNPEERRAFALALELAEQVQADIVIGTDPDADRLGIISRTKDGDYLALSGNQIGALLLQYILEQRQAAGTLPANGVMLKSIVTSELGRKIASHFGVTTVDVLTGFKYIGEKIEEYAQTGAHQFLFGYEESYGYLIGSFVRDKDAVQAAMLACEMAAFYKQQGLTLEDLLARLCAQHGHHLEDQFSYTFQGKAGQEKMERMMDVLRRTPPVEIGGLPVSRVLDYGDGLNGMPAANVLKYELSDTSWVAIRPSGTEPKIKFYFSAVDPDEANAVSKLASFKSCISELVETLS